MKTCELCGGNIEHPRDSRKLDDMLVCSDCYEIEAIRE
jgi:ribosome-binding protein aMBF1 (putative translation factor)